MSEPIGCSTSKKKFVTALMEWMLLPPGEDKSGPPELVDFGLCRGCGIDIVCQIAEANFAYAQDMAGIVHATQDQLEEFQVEVEGLKGGGEAPKPFKH